MERLELEGQQAVGVGIEFEVLFDFSVHPLGVQRGLRAGDDGEAAAADAGRAPWFELGRAALLFLEPDAQVVLFVERADQRFDPRRVVVVVTDEEIELAQRQLVGEVGRQQRVVGATLVELWQESVGELQRARRRALFQPARR